MRKSWPWLCSMLLGLLACSLASCSNPGPTIRAMAAVPLAGSLSIRVTLPLRTQALVSNTQSVKILLRNPGLLGSDRLATANGSGPQTLTLSALPPGSGYALYAGAYSGANGTGTLMSWGSMPLTIQSGSNNASLGLSVRVAAGNGTDDLVNGPAGSSTGLLGAQWVQTTLGDFLQGTTSAVEPFVPGMYGTVTSFGSSGTANGQFSTVESMAIDRNGYLYVSDRSNHRVQVFDSNLNFVRAWGNGQVWTSGTPAPAPQTGGGNGWFNQTGGLAVDPNGNVYVADIYNYRLQKFTSGGTFLMGWGEGTTWTSTPPSTGSGSASGWFSTGDFLALDSESNVYVSDYNNARIQKFTASGAFLLGIGNGSTWTGAAPTPAAGNGPGYFQTAPGPAGLAVDGQNNLYVADLGNDRIQKFNAAGTYVSQWGGASSLDGQFPNGVAGIGFDAFGRLWAGGGSSENFAQVFSTSGQYLSHVVGQTANQLLGARCMTSDASGTLFVGNGSGVITRFRGASSPDANGGIRLTGYRTVGASNFSASGTYASPVLDAMGPATWGSIYWVVSNLPSGTGVSMAVATSSDDVAWSAFATVGGSSVVGANTANLGAAFASRFLKYQLTLTSSSAATSSEVQEVGVIY